MPGLSRDQKFKIEFNKYINTWKNNNIDIPYSIRNITPNKIYNFEELMKGVVRMQPNEYHLNLGLGMINYEIRKNNTMAEKYYKEFLKTTRFEIDKPIELDIYLKLSNIKNITI